MIIQTTLKLMTLLKKYKKKINSKQVKK